MPRSRRLVRTLILAAILVTATCGFAPAAYAKRASQTASISLDASHTLLISSAGKDVKFASKKTGPGTFGVSQRSYTYAIRSTTRQVGRIVITVRTLPSNTRFVFAQLDSFGSALSANVAVATPSTHSSFVNLHNVPDLSYSVHTGVNRSSGPLGWYTLSHGGTFDTAVFASKAYRYQKLVKKYSGGGTSSIRRFVSETSQATVARASNGTARLKYGLSATGDSCQRYLVISPRRISDTSVKAYSVKSVTGEWRWLDPKGSYQKVSWAIVPATKSGFARSLLSLRADATMNGYKATGSKLFEDFLVNDLYMLSLIRSADGLWRTEYTNTWVSKESGIVAPYVDTRHNEILALQMLKITDELVDNGVTNVAGARKWAFPYANFLLARANSGARAVTSTAHGFFFADYYDASGRAKVHTSLNHGLGEMNYLFTVYSETSSTPALSVAKRIKAAVDDTGRGWIRSNKDLHYQRNRDGSYEGKDYDTVTYWDLVASQRNFKKFLGAYDPIFSQLIASKASFLKRPNDDPARNPLSTGITTTSEFLDSMQADPAELP